MWIHIVCGAGASSMFIAKRLQKAAMAAGMSIRTSAGSLASSGDLTSDPELVLLGSHLSKHQSDLASQLPTTDVCVLPPDAGQDFGGQRTLALVLARIEAGSLTPRKESS